MRGDDDLRRALSELETSVPTGTASIEPANGRTTVPWAAMAAVVAVAIVAGFVVAGIPRSDGVGQQTPTMVPSGHASKSAAPSPATTAPSPSSSAAEWVVASHDLDLHPLSLSEIRGVLYATGSTEEGQPAIWHSQDGESWTAADVPVVDERLPEQPDLELGGTVRSIVDVGERLVALATVGYADGPGIYGTKLYVSDDGDSWDEVTATPGVLPPSGRAMYDLAVVGNRLIAAGDGAWISSDGGLGWTDEVDAGSFDGVIHELEADGNLLVALGGSLPPFADVGPGETYAWVSRDEGTSWNRHALDDGIGAADPRAIAIDESGSITIITSSIGAASDPLASVVEFGMWRSDDLGETWSLLPHPDVECCVLDLIATPTELVIATYATSEAGEPSVLRSADGSDWTVEHLDVNPLAIAWTPTFGLVALGADSITFYRDPVP